MIPIDLEPIKEKPVQDAFEILDEELRINKPWMKGTWSFLEYEFTVAGTSIAVAHGLGFAPKDVIIIGKDAEETASICWGETDSTYIYMDIGGAVTVRMFIGTHTEELN